MTDTQTLDPPVWLGDEDSPTDELPRRPRRRLVTPVTAGLTAVIIAAAGFIGGVQVQKGSGPPAATGAPQAGGGAGARQGSFPGGPPGAAGGAGGSDAAAAFTTGEVKSKDGSVLYVTDANGTTVKVKTTSNSEISRTAKASAGAIHPGDTVVIQGTTAASGTVTATNVRATASGVTGGGGFGGRGPAGGGAPPVNAGNGGAP